MEDGLVVRLSRRRGAGNSGIQRVLYFSGSAGETFFCRIPIKSLASYDSIWYSNAGRKKKSSASHLRAKATWVNIGRV